MTLLKDPDIHSQKKNLGKSGFFSTIYLLLLKKTAVFYSNEIVLINIYKAG